MTTITATKNKNYTNLFEVSINDGKRNTILNSFSDAFDAINYGEDLAYKMKFTFKNQTGITE